jgi:hypothetical protein
MERDWRRSILFGDDMTTQEKIDKLIEEEDKIRLSTAEIKESQEKVHMTDNVSKISYVPVDHAENLLLKWASVLQYSSREKRVKRLFKEGKITEEEAFEELL